MAAYAHYRKETMTSKDESERLVNAKALEKMIAEILEQVGVPRDEASLLADALVCADARGMNSHGVMRLPVYVKRMRSGGIKPGRKGKILKETASTVLLDGEDGIGQVIATKAMQEAIRKAKEAGVGIVGVTRSNHFGEAAYYVIQAVQHDTIGLITTNGSVGMPLWGGLSKLTGPLPIAVGIPSGTEFPIVLDIALGTVSKGKILYAAGKGEKIPLGWGVDSQGRPTDDPQKVLDGGWTPPIGGYKGSGLILVAEVLSGVLTGGRFSNEIGDLYADVSSPQGLGHFVMAIDIEAFMPKNEFKRRVDFLIRLIKNSTLAPGFEEILIPGEREFKMEGERRDKGIPLSAEVLNQLESLAKEVRYHGGE